MDANDTQGDTYDDTQENYHDDKEKTQVSTEDMAKAWELVLQL